MSILVRMTNSRTGFDERERKKMKEKWSGFDEKEGKSTGKGKRKEKKLYLIKNDIRCPCQINYFLTCQFHVKKYCTRRKLIE